jgi:hypothetical protein
LIAAYGVRGATPENDAINACARAFATTLAPPGVAVARANCFTDTRGAVVAFTPIPLSN